MKANARWSVGRAPAALLSVAAAAVLAACGVAAQSSVPSSTLISSPMPSSTGSIEPLDPSPSDLDQGGAGEFQLPSPACPSPPGPVTVPDVRVSIGTGPAIIATRGASTFSTCTTTSATDVTGDAPLPWLTATHQDRITLQVQNGWRIVRVEGYDSPAVGDGANVDQPVDLPSGPDRVDVVVPFRGGDARAGWTLWLIRVDGRVVGQLEVAVRIHLPAAGG